MVSAAWREAYYAPQTDEVELTIVKITHPSLSEPVRVVADYQALTHLGEVYEPAGFSVQKPEEGDGLSALAQIGIENVSRGLVAALRAGEGAPLVTIKTVLASAPDVIEEEWPAFDLVQASYDAAQITGALSLPDLMQLPFGGVFVPSRWGGIA